MATPGITTQQSLSDVRQHVQQTILSDLGVHLFHRNGVEESLFTAPFLITANTQAGDDERVERYTQMQSVYIKVMRDLRDTVVTTESLQQVGTVVAADKIELSERVSSIFHSHYRGMFDAAVAAVKRHVRQPSDSQSHHDDEQLAAAAAAAEATAAASAAAHHHQNNGMGTFLPNTPANFVVYIFQRVPLMTMMMIIIPRAMMMRIIITTTTAVLMIVHFLTTMFFSLTVLFLQEERLFLPSVLLENARKQQQQQQQQQLQLQQQKLQQQCTGEVSRLNNLISLLVVLLKLHRTWTDG